MKIFYESETEYGQTSSFYEDVLRNLSTYIAEILHNEGIEYEKIESRVKNYVRLTKKIERKKKEGLNPEDNIHDILGLRIVAYYTDDVDKIVKIVDELFLVISEYSEDKSKTTKPNVFDYISVHKVVQIKEELCKKMKWKYYETLFIEIQIRTLLQHAWASRSHKLHYADDVPLTDTLTRRLSRLAGLLELADDEFLEIRNQKSSLPIEELYKEKHIELNVDTIKDYFSQSHVLKSLINYANEINLKIRINPRNNFLDNINILCGKLKLTSADEIERYLSSRFEKLKNALRIYIKESKHGSYNIDSLLEILIILISQDKLNVNNETENYQKEYREWVREAANKLNQVYTDKDKAEIDKKQ